MAMLWSKLDLSVWQCLRPCEAAMTCLTHVSLLAQVEAQKGHWFDLVHAPANVLTLCLACWWLVSWL